jgi:glycosyltransferase involved in cell wall biosynthesis
MRLALVTNTLPPEGGGGAEAYVADLAREFGSRHAVLVLTAARSTPPGIETVRLPGLPPLRHDASPAAKALWHARDQWLPAVHRHVRRALERFEPDVVHTHAVQGLSAAVFTAIRSLGVRHVHTAHDLGLLCARVTMTRDGEYCGGRCLECRVQRAVRARAARSRLDFLIAPSDHIRRRHVEFGAVDEARTVTIRQGAAPAQAVERPIGAPAAPRLGYIGSLSRVKGIETLLDAFRHAPPHWRLVVGGNGELEPLAARRAAEDGRIEFLGRIDEAAKEAFYRELDVLVIPSEWEENAPLVAVEAAMRGLPTVVSDRGGLPEIQGAEVFRSRDRAALLEAVGRLVDSPELLAAKSRGLIESRERFLWRTHVAEVEQVLHQAVASAR